MKTAFWRFHKNASVLFYRTPEGVLHETYVHTGFVQGENFSSFWYAIGQGPSFETVMNIFEKYDAKAPPPYVGDVPFLVKLKTRAKIDEHPTFLECDWAKAGGQYSLGKAVMHR